MLGGDRSAWSGDEGVEGSLQRKKVATAEPSCEALRATARPKRVAADDGASVKESSSSCATPAGMRAGAFTAKCSGTSVIKGARAVVPACLPALGMLA